MFVSSGLDCSVGLCYTVSFVGNYNEQEGTKGHLYFVGAIYKGGIQ